MLTLIGSGLFDEKDITIRGIEEAKKVDKAYIELYTSKWFGNLKNLEKTIGKKIIELTRSDLEENSQKILEEAEKSNIVIFVLGDPLVATTHSSLILEAKKKKIKVKVIHNASIISAIGETGLHLQKFGPYVTIPFPEKTRGKLPESIYEIIKMNRARGLHTLCLLDIKKDKAMAPKEAIKILIDLENIRKENVIKKDLGIIVFSKAGSENSKIIFDTIGNLKNKEIDTPAVLIIPGILHFTEKEFISNL
jgi:diphthine synthase